MANLTNSGNLIDAINAKQNLIIQSANQPSNPNTWDYRYDTTNKLLKYYNWSSWDAVWANVRVLTQSEYDQLTPAEKSNWTLYLITWDSDQLTIAWENVTDKPTFATVATSGAYNDLSWKPTIPTVNDTTITFTQNWVSVWDITLNQSSAETIALTDTTYTAGTWIDITNWVISNTQTSAERWNITWTLADQTDLNTALSGKQDNLTAQTAYTSKGSATKVPQITTNTLWQVTGITEVTITQPTKTSDLTNDSWFITNAVNDLTNYYKKTETYTQAEVNSLVQNFQWFEIVATLPSSNIKTNVIYLLWPTGSGADKYEEYVYANSTWVKIWDTSVDLTNYFNKSTQTSDAITEWSTNLFLTSAERTKLSNTSGTNTWDQSASDFDIKDLTDSTGLRSTWSWKQDALTAQTAYSAKWSATKVPQITTNSLWQVTSITEVTITQPDISWKANTSDVLTKTNTTSYTPSADYHPATKKYVDDHAGTEYNAWQWISIGDVSMNSRRWPCPEWFHVPSVTEWEWLNTIMAWLNLNTWLVYTVYLHMPVAGRRDLSDSSLDSQGSLGFYWSSSPFGSDDSDQAFYLRLDLFSEIWVDGHFRAHGFSIRCFKDSFEVPTSSWTVIEWTLGSAWIFRNQTDGLISITSDWSTGYTIMDKNLWATTVWSDWDTRTQANMWNIYQWWNNYWFPSTWTISNTSTTQVDASWYWPSTANWYYESDTFIIESFDWSSVQNDDLWWDTTWTITQDNVISNTWVLSVNGQTGNVTISWWADIEYVTEAEYDQISWAGSDGKNYFIVEPFSLLLTSAGIASMATAEWYPRTNTIAELNWNASDYFTQLDGDGYIAPSGTDVGSNIYYTSSYWLKSSVNGSVIIWWSYSKPYYIWYNNNTWSSTQVVWWWSND